MHGDITQDNNYLTHTK